MQPIKFYEELPDMEFTAGDTLPVFIVTVSGDSSNATMFLILSLRSNPVEAVITKECIMSSESTYEVQLDSSDTSGLIEGEYIMEFILDSSGGNSYKKLRGSVYVHGSIGG